MKTINIILKYVDKGVNSIVYLILIVFLLLGAYSMYDVFLIYNGAELPKEIIKYIPDGEDDYSLEELQKINQDICAWITIDDTNINYPVVQGKNNTEYLSKDYLKEYSVSGSVFLDYRNSFQLEDNCSVIYGHNIKGNLMFSDIKAFKEQDFFNTHKTGRIYTNKEKYELEIIAYCEVSAYSREVYSVINNRRNLTNELINYIKKTAISSRQIELENTDKILILSTCHKMEDQIRAILVAKFKAE